jgi:hypothetical protein
VALGIPARIAGHGVGLDVEGHAERLEVGTEPRGVVAVHELVGVLGQELDGRTPQHEDDLVLAGDDAQADAHGLVGPVGDARILGDHDDDGSVVGHGLS